nr:hypothetical protein BN993_06157 [Virgibacillus halodenitrificans]
MHRSLVMQIEGKDIEEGVRDWAKEEIKLGPFREYDLGKFFFGVSTGTIGVLLVAEKMQNPCWSWQLIISFIGLLTCAAVSLFMVIPKGWKVGGATDIQDKRNGIIQRIVYSSYIWFSIWTVSLIFGAWAVLH